MANNTEAYCPNCGKYTLHFAYSGGWECDECEEVNDVRESPFKEDW